LERLRDRGMAIIFVSHKLDEVFRICDAVTVLRDGEVVAESTVADLDIDGLVELVAGRALAELEVEQRQAGAPALTAQGVVTGAVGPIDLELREGEVVALTGLLGSGNDEFARSVAGAQSRHAGEVDLHGRSLASGDRAQASRRGLGFIPEDRKVQAVVPHLSVEQNIALASIRKVTKSGRVSRKRMREQAEHFIKLLRIRPPDPKMPLANLSGGNQQKVIMARWLASDATVLVLEEPTHGLDVGAKAEIHALLQQFAHGDRAVLMVSSELAEIVKLADRIGVFRSGKLVATLPRGVSEQEVASRSVRTPAGG
jgi:ABC-type sugar transport system ATPase subunit